MICQTYHGKSQKEGSLWDNFDAEQEQAPRRRSLPDMSDVDIRNFFELPIEPRRTDPCQWWANEGKKRFPLMQQLASKYLAIPATSVPSERVFSAAGEVISKKRNRIGDDNARMLTVLHGNL